MAQDTTRLMTREQVADFIISELREYESKGLIAPPSTQTISKQAKREANVLSHKILVGQADFFCCCDESFDEL